MDTVNLNEFKSQLNNLKEIYNEDLGVLRKLELEKKEKEEELKEFRAKEEAVGIKKALLHDACVEARKGARDILQNMSTRGLQSIMGDHVSLDIVLKETGTPEAEFVVKSEYGDNYVVENDPADGDGGGVADIVSLANFFSMNYLAGKKNVAPILLDEPTKFVSAGHSENAAKFLYEISTYFKKQVLMSTHDKFLANLGDKSFMFELDAQGRTQVTPM